MNQAGGQSIRRQKEVPPMRLKALTALLLVGFAPATHAGQATATVNTVNINEVWGGFFIQLNIPLTQSYESACPQANWAFVPLTDPFYASLLATALAARASGEIVTVSTNGCVATSVAPVPKITSIDYGVRMGS